MKMDFLNKFVPVVALLTLSAPVFAADGTLAITGLVAAQGCTTTTPTGADAKLGRYIKSYYATPGTVGTAAIVMIQATGCPVGTKLGFLLEGPADTDNTNLFKVPAGTGQAQGIGISIETTGTLAQKFIPNTLSQWYPTTGNGIALALRIKPVSTLATGSIVAGKLDTPITYTLKYN